jgi:hypothetical protein
MSSSVGPDLTGKLAEDYAREKLFTPLGIKPPERPCHRELLLM